MQQHPSISVPAVLAVAVALAGCLGQAPGAEPSPTSTTPSPAGAAPPGAAPTATARATADGPGAAEGLPAAPSIPFALHLTAERTLQLEPAAEGTLTLDTPVNSPFTTGYPAWEGALPVDVALGPEGVPVVFYVTASTASVAASTVPVFQDLPGFFVGLRIGDAQLGAELDGPPVLVAGEVAEVAGVLRGHEGLAATGDPARLAIDVIYSHASTAAEFRYVFGPEYPAHLGFNGSS